MNLPEVWEVTPISLENANENELFNRTYRVLLNWIKYSDKRFGEWNVRPDCGHFFGGSYWYGLETATTVLVYAVAAASGKYDEKITGVSREEIISKAVKAIRYLGFTHDTGPEECVREKGRNPHCSGMKWGGRDDNFFMSSQHGTPISNYGLAAWLLWDYLDNETRVLVQNVLSSYADRWSGEEPRSGTYNDTQTEENGWTAAGISIAAAMFKKHPKSQYWREGMYKWSINVCTTYLDMLNREPYLGKPLAYGWINTVTTHPDFTAENHGFVHPNYMMAGIMFRGFICLLDRISGVEFPPHLLMHWNDVYDSTLKVWSGPDGVSVPVQGQDWWYNQHPSLLFLHSSMNVLGKSSDAACLERLTLDYLEKIQQSNGNGCLYEADGKECILNEYQTAEDMEHYGASLVASACLLHCINGLGEKPSEAGELSSRLTGVYNYPYGSSIIARTDRSFTSFTWRSCVMALSSPANGMWTTTALPGSYVGRIRLEGEKGDRSLFNEDVVYSVKDEKIIPQKEGFAASIRIERGCRELLQDAAFIALPEGVTVYIERITAASDCMVLEFATGLIGIRNEYYKYLPEVAKGSRNVYVHDDVVESFKGYYGKTPDQTECWKGISHINIDDEIGYVMLNSSLTEYWNRHQYPQWKGVEDVLALNKRACPFNLNKGESIKPFVAVTLPNANRNETSEAAAKLLEMKTSNPEMVAVILNDYLVYGYFGYGNTVVSCSVEDNRDSYLLFKGNNKLEGNRYVWRGDVVSREAGWIKACFRVELCDDHEALLEADIAYEDHVVLHNLNSNSVHLILTSLKTGEKHEVKLQPGGFHILGA